jgi:hypothetical protein
VNRYRKTILENLFHAVFGSDEVCEAEVLKFALLFGSWVVRKQNRNISSEVVLQPFCIVMIAMKV